MAVIVKKPTQQQIDDFKYNPTWECSPAVLHSNYVEDEYFLLIYGDADLVVDGGETYTIGAGDLVLCTKGTKLDWVIRKRLKKYYKCVTTVG